jgi:hypothetical protein
MEMQDFLLYSQYPAKGLHSESDESSPHPHIPFP